jgi:hypothetical protein
VYSSPVCGRGWDGTWLLSVKAQLAPERLLCWEKPFCTLAKEMGATECCGVGGLLKQPLKPLPTFQSQEVAKTLPASPWCMEECSRGSSFPLSSQWSIAVLHQVEWVDMGFIPISTGAGANKQDGHHTVALGDPPAGQND